MSLDGCRVVLVEPHYAGNIGATARVMCNLGLRDLVLVNPVADPLDQQSLQMSTHGEPMLRAARTVTRFDDAVADCVLVIGTSARNGGLFRQQSVAGPDVVMPMVAEILRQGERAAIVFGPEPTGLANEIVTRCHHLVCIPTDEVYPALNLAQAVAICLYEISKASRERERTENAPDSPHLRGRLASHAEHDEMFRHLQTALEEIHFLYGEKAEPLMHAIRHLLGRAQLSVMEVKLLHGLARQIHWFVANHPRTTGSNPEDSTP
jgi:tRNA/rRNA methyltransferase